MSCFVSPSVESVYATSDLDGAGEFTVNKWLQAGGRK
jgi:hypothetical protein